MTVSRRAKSLLGVGIVTAVFAIPGIAQQSTPEPQIPVHNFRSPEDTRKNGMKPEDIKAGVRPDYTRIRDKLVVMPVRGQVHLIAGAGANIAAQVGLEGVVLVDTGVAESADKVVASLQTLSARPARWIINTSDDLDHTGGNEAIGSTGVGAPGGPTGGPQGGLASLGAATPTGAAIVQFETVLQRMSTPSASRPARPAAAWATSSFYGPKKKLYYNGEPIELLHQPAAYTDGDVIVHFRSSDVIATGEVFNTDRYPHFDLARGGSMQGVIDGLNHIIDIAVPEYNMQGGTLVIPGHGWVANQADVVEVRDMATIIRDRVKTMVDKRMTLAQIKAARPTLDYDAWYGAAAGPWTTDMFLDALYQNLTARQPSATRTK